MNKRLNKELINIPYYFAGWELVVYGCETWYVTVKDEQRLCVFQKKVLRKICGPNRDRLTGDKALISSDQ